VRKKVVQLLTFSFSAVTPSLLPCGLSFSPSLHLSVPLSLCLL